MEENDFSEPIFQNAVQGNGETGSWRQRRPWFLSPLQHPTHHSPCEQPSLPWH